MVDVVVVGGGLAGLLTGAELKRRGAEVLVLEAADRPGGVAATIERDGYLFEPAAGTLLLPNPPLDVILEAVGAASVPTRTSAGRRYVYTRERLVELRPSPGLLLGPVVSPAAKMRVLAEPFVPKPDHVEDESVESFFSRRLGGEVGRLAATMMSEGTFAGDPAKLSVRSAFPMLAGLERRSGSFLNAGWQALRHRDPSRVRPSSRVPVGGMANLAATLVRYLGSGYRSAFPVEAVARVGERWVVEGSESILADHVVVALSPEQAREIVPAPLGEALGSVQAAPVAVIGLGGKGIRLPEGFGYLAGPDADLVGIGCLFESSYAPGRAPAGHGLAKVIAGGARHPEVVDWDDDRIVDRVGAEMSRVLGVSLEASFVEVVRHRPGIPQYNIGHGAWLAEIERRLVDLPGLLLTGWAYRGVGVAQLAADAHRIAGHVMGLT